MLAQATLASGSVAWRGETLVVEYLLVFERGVELRSSCVAGNGVHQLSG